MTPEERAAFRRQVDDAFWELDGGERFANGWKVFPAEPHTPAQLSSGDVPADRVQDLLDELHGPQ